MGRQYHTDIELIIIGIRSIIVILIMIIIILLYQYKVFFVTLLL